MGRSHILKGFADVDAALWVLSEGGGGTIPHLVELAESSGLRVTDSTRFEAVQILTELELAQRDPRSLTESGKFFYRLWQTRRSDAIDVLHGLQYGLWKPTEPGENVASWAYRTICDFLWTQQMVPEKDSLSRFVTSQRSATVAIPSDVGEAFSQKSIADAYDWLAPLDPPVFEGIPETGLGRNFKQTTFQRRAYCSTPLFLMGLDHLLRAQNQQYGDLVLLDGESQRALCCFCLIDEAAVELMLDAALRRFPHLLSFQREWGAFITLTRPPVMHDFL